MKPKWKLLSTLMLLLMLVTATVPARAALQAVGPTDLVTTIPSWYQDTNNLALQPCLDQNGFCLLPPPFDPAFPPVSPITTTGTINDTNFPGEGFYYSADALLPIEGGELARLTFVLEFAFLAGVFPDGGTTFLRTDLQKMRNLAANSTYRVTHPYGQFQFTTDTNGNTTGGGGVAVRQEDPAGVPANWFPPLFKSAAITNIGPFLTPASGIFPTAIVGTETHTYIGDAVTPVPVTGSPTGNNFYRIERLNANGSVVATWETNLFVLAGRVFTGQIPSQMTIDRATYARDAVSQQIDVFVTALPTAVLSIGGTGLASSSLTQDVPNTGKFFTHIPVADIPTGVAITNSLDVPPVIHPVTLVDEVNITLATFDPVASKLTIMAASRDKLAPLPTLTVSQLAAPNTLDATGILVKTLTTIPPQTVTVTSSHGGTATAPVSVVIAQAAPQAANDSTTTSTGAAVTVNVIANDTATSPATIDPATLAIAGFPANGTVVPRTDGTVTYTPNANYSGTDNFTYTVRDSLGAISNVATVTVNVAAPAAATGVTATATPGGTQTINTPVVITATGTGGSGTYEYRFYVNDGGTFYLLQPYSSSNTCTWVPGKAGAFDFFVEVRSAGSTVLRDAYTNIFAYVVTSPAATNVYLSTDKLSPQAANTPITFTAQGVGGVGTYEYRFWLNSGAGFTVAQPYSTVNTWTWTPTVAGSYDMFVEVRMVGSTGTRDAFNEIVSYSIQ